MAKSFDVIVVGVGSMGSAACYHLARRGISVLGLEQFELPHTRGSHHGSSRMIRQAYFEAPEYVPLLARAYDLWAELQSCASREDADQFLHLTGGLYLGTADGSLVSGSLAAARTHNLPHEILDCASLSQRFPSFKVPEDFVGFFEERAGFLVPEEAIRSHCAEAVHAGGALHTDEAMLSWERTAEGVRVRSNRGSYEAGHLILTAGAWTSPQLRDLEIELTVTRQVLAWFDPQVDPARFALGRFPCWFVETDPPYGHYGFPMTSSWQPGLKIAMHKPGEQIEPGELGAARSLPSPEEIEELRGVLEDLLPGGGGPLLAACTCLYTNSSDHHFVLGLHPVHDRVSIAAGFSGHGFKFASVVGEILADLATTGETRHPIDFLSPGRFGK